MYSLPKDFDGGKWVGKTLELVCFAEHTICFHFEGDLSITPESCFSYQLSSMNAAPEPIKVPVAESNLMSLVGHKIRKAQDEGNGTLRIEFDNDEILRCFDPPEPYESYQINDVGKLTIV